MVISIFCYHRNKLNTIYISVEIVQMTRRFTCRCLGDRSSALNTFMPFEVIMKLKVLLDGPSDCIQKEKAH